MESWYHRENIELQTISNKYGSLNGSLIRIHSIEVTLITLAIFLYLLVILALFSFNKFEIPAENSTFHGAFHYTSWNHFPGKLLRFPTRENRCGKLGNFSKQRENHWKVIPTLLSNSRKPSFCQCWLPTPLLSATLLKVLRHFPRKRRYHNTFK